METILVSLRDMSTEEINGKIYEGLLREKACKKNAIIVQFTPKGFHLIDPMIETGDHFNVGVSFKTGKIVFFDYQSTVLSFRDVVESKRLWTRGPITFLAVFTAIENFLKEELGHRPKMENWITSRLS